MSSQDQQELEWYIWKIRPSKFEFVEKFINDKVKEVKNILCPTVVSEKFTKGGERKQKKSALYEGYLFLQYHHDVKNPTVWLKLSKYPFIVGYVGPCSPEDLKKIKTE